MSDKISIINKTKDQALSLSFAIIENLKNEILGKDYNLSIAYVGEKTSKDLNFKFRNKNKSTNILSFTLSESSGELVICPMVLKREAKNFNKTPKKFLGFLVIHGMLHLKGLEHGSIMERQEEKYDKKYFSSYRHRISNDKSASRRVSKKRRNS